MILALTGAAFAQVPARQFGSGPTLDDKGVPYSSQYWSGQPRSNVISLIRKPELTEDQFILRVTNPYAMSGCADLSNYGYSAEYKDVYLDIAIGNMTIDLRNQPRYGHFQCNKKTQVPVADIILNRQDLLDHETRQIRLHGETDANYYTITMSDDRVMILPDEGDAALVQRFSPQNVPGRKTSLIYWFYPVGTVMLWVPGTENDSNTTEKLRAYAKEQGLIPLETIFPDFESPLTRTQYQYFVDTAGHYDENDPALANGKPVGMLSVDKTVFGLEKDEIVLDEKAVYAKLPGMYE